MIVLGLTGSIAMGKSTAAAMLRRSGVPVWDADRAVHRLFERGGAAVAPIAAAFPAAVANGRVDRAALGARVFDDRAALRRLEAIVHPLVRAERRGFLATAARQRRPLVVLDIPLLFEVGADRECDRVMVVSAPPAVHLARLRKRGLDRARIQAILSRQMPDAEKRARAAFVVPTGLGRAPTARAIRAVLRRLSCGGGAPRRGQRRYGYLDRARPKI